MRYFSPYQRKNSRQFDAMPLYLCMTLSDGSLAYYEFRQKAKVGKFSAKVANI
jgi:hypothetical protein